MRAGSISIAYHHPPPCTDLKVQGFMEHAARTKNLRLAGYHAA